MFATIPGCNRGVTTGKRIAIRRALSTNRNEIADEIFHTLRAAVDLAAMSPDGPSVISLRRGCSVAFGLKRTLSRIYEYTP